MQAPGPMRTKPAKHGTAYVDGSEPQCPSGWMPWLSHVRPTFAAGLGSWASGVHAPACGMQKHTSSHAVALKAAALETHDIHANATPIHHARVKL